MVNPKLSILGLEDRILWDDGSLFSYHSSISHYEENVMSNIQTGKEFRQYENMDS